MKNLYCPWAAAFLWAGLLAPPMAGLAAQSGPSLILDQLIEIGLDNNSDIRIAERNLQSARAGRRSSASGLIPHLTASMSTDMDPKGRLTEGGIWEEPPKYGSTLTLNQTIFDGAQSWYDLRSGNLTVASAEAGLEQIRQETILAIKDAYYTYLSNVDLFEVAEEALEISRRQLELVEERYRLQAVSKTDLLKARVNVGKNEVKMHQARQAESTAATSLIVVLGQDPSTAISVARDSVVLGPLPDRQLAFGSLQANNPGLRVIALEVKQAWLDARKQRGILLPSVRLQYKVSSGGPDFQDAYDFDFENNSSTKLIVGIPLFTGFQNTSGYSQARYGALIKEENFEDGERKLIGNLEDTLSNLESLHNIYPINQEVLTSAEADVRLADEQYNLGAISILDLLDAQVSLITARNDLVQTTYEIKIAEAQLAALMGTIGQ